MKIVIYYIYLYIYKIKKNSKAFELLYITCRRGFTHMLQQAQMTYTAR